MIASRPSPVRRSRRSGVPGALPAATLLLGIAGCEAPLGPGLQLGLTQGEVEFRAVRGSSAPVTLTVGVSNRGSGRLGPVTCPASPASWLACSVNDGTSVILTADPSGLEASPSPVPVPLEAPGGSASVTVRLVLEQPVLAVSPGTLTFSALEGSSDTSPASATVTVTNGGAGTIANLGALTCAPVPTTARVSCAVDPGQGTLTVNADPQGLGPGTHVFPLEVEAEHSAVSQTVAVSVVVSAAPRIGLSRQTVLFQAVRGGPPPAAQTVTVSNLGGGSLGTVSCPAVPASWLTCAVAGETVTFTANPAGLTTDPVAVSVPISASGALNSPQTVEVGLTLQQPVLSLTRSELSFTAPVDSTQAAPAQDTVTVTNTGTGTLANLGEIACTPPTGAPVTCTPDAATGRLTVSVNPTGLPRGEHTWLVEVSADNSEVSRILTVRLRVTAPSALAFSPPALHLQAIRGSTTPQVDTVLVSNAGDGGLGVLSCPGAPEPWLACSVLSGNRLQIIANPTGLVASPVPAGIVVSADSVPDATLQVTLTLQQPILTVSAARVDFTSVAGSGVTAPASVPVTVTNTGAGDLPDLGAIACTPPGGSPVGCVVDPATGVLTLTVNPTGLAVGTHVWLVEVTAAHAGNVGRTVTVVLTVT